MVARVWIWEGSVQSCAGGSTTPHRELGPTRTSRPSLAREAVTPLAQVRALHSELSPWVS